MKMIIMQNKIITIWSRLSSVNKFEHNHISDGWDENEQVPTPCTKNQKSAWRLKRRWKKEKGELINGEVHEYKE